jgi:hypothetical protein
MTESAKFDIAVFYNHEIQSIFALFLSNPDLYKDYSTQRNRQDYLFYAFRKFAADYYHFSEDESVYFSSTRKESAGEANICGGGGGSRGRYFKNRYHAAEQTRETRINHFAKKYGVSFEKGRDTRQFLGVTEIWNHLDRAIDILAASKWSNVVGQSYSDTSFSTPIPAKLDKLLVPFAIRNRAMQKYRHSQRTPDAFIGKLSASADESEEPDTRTRIVVVLPPEIDEDW